MRNLNNSSKGSVNNCLSKTIKTFKFILICTMTLIAGNVMGQNLNTTDKDSIDELFERLEQIGHYSGSISDFFTEEEQLQLKSHMSENLNETTTNTRSTSGTTAWCAMNTTNQFGFFDPADGSTVTAIGPSPTVAFENAGAINPADPDTAWVLDMSGDAYSVDVTTGVYTILGNIPGVWLGAEFDPTTGIFYAIDSVGDLYSVDVPNLSKKLIGSTGFNFAIALAIDGDGNAYTYNLADDNLYAIDLETGAPTLIGPIGFDANFGQGMFWDAASDTVFMTAFNGNSFVSELRTVNTSTGSTSVINQMEGNNQVQFAWASTPGTLPQATLAFQQIYNGRGVVEGSVSFGDVDNDGDQDVLITGASSISPSGIGGPLYSAIYKNDGSGVFTEDTENSFMGLAYSSSSFKDINNDTYPDIIITGEDINTGINYDNFYLNDGTGNFTPSAGPTFTNFVRKDFALADLDGDSDDDIMIMGLNSAGQPRIKVFDIQGNSASIRINLSGVRLGSIDFGDIDGDGLPDLFVSGQLPNGTKVSRLYKNNGGFLYSPVLGTTFANVDSGDSKFADVDDDGDMDLLISGLDANQNNILKLYLNDGFGNFTEAVDIFDMSGNIFIQAFDIADIDGDNDLDIVMTGYNTGQYRTITKIWENLLYNPSRDTRSNSTLIIEDVQKVGSSFGNNISVYPNPTDKGYFNIGAPNLEGKVSLLISDMQGRTVLSQDKVVESNNVQVFTEDISSGIYMVTLKKGSQSYVTKVFVK